MFDTVEFIEIVGQEEPSETLLGEFPDEMAAANRAREARATFLESGHDDYAWWMVREQGARLALFIADSKSDKELILDLTTGQLVEV